MISIAEATAQSANRWDAYVLSHPHASVYHQYAFRNTVTWTYRRKSHYLVAHDPADAICGVLPLFYIPSFLLGNSVVSLPFCDYGGILCDSDDAGKALFSRAREISRQYKARFLELRQTGELQFADLADPCLRVNSEKVRMSVALPSSSEELFKSFKDKLRAQIRKPGKEGCICKIGGVELLADFYSVFLYNMRDLGSPVHPPTMIRNTLECYGENARLFVVYHQSRPVAGAVGIGFRDTVVNPWASSDRRYQKIAPNMLLYWSMLEYATQKGYRIFDFGRSTEGEGTYRFKAQWGAAPQPLHWYSQYDAPAPSDSSGPGSKERFIGIWRRLPLRATALLGPLLRRSISL